VSLCACSVYLCLCLTNSEIDSRPAIRIEHNLHLVVRLGLLKPKKKKKSDLFLVLFSSLSRVSLLAVAVFTYGEDLFLERPCDSVHREREHQQQVAQHVHLLLSRSLLQRE
jgi:hypothetical protein